jgi:cell wall-associated NlpC family hydrolase
VYKRQTTTTTTPLPTPSIPAPTNGGHPDAASIALQYIGIPYVFGGSTTDGFDCSGLVMYVYAQLGIQLPHFAAAQYTFGQPVSRADLQPGDLVFFDALDHVGIYIGNGEFVDAPHTGAFVRIDTFVGWYSSTYVGARRL